MDKHELKAIQGFLSAVGADANGAHNGAVLSDRLSELSRVIQRLMSARVGSGSLRSKVYMANLERTARRYRRQIEVRLNEGRG
jgi:hypothetical protein